MRTSRVLASVPLLLAGCGESAIQSSPPTASQEPAPRPPAPLVVDDDPKPVIAAAQELFRARPEASHNSELSPRQRQALINDFLKALHELPLRDPWSGLPGLDIPGPNYDRWDMGSDRDSRGKPTRSSL